MMAQLLNLFRPTPEPESVPAGEVAWATSQLYKGDFPKYNPDQLIGRKGYDIYRKMMIDEQVKAVVKFKRDAITSRDFIFTLEDESLSESEAKDRILLFEDMIDNVCGSFNDGLNFIMAAMYQGFSLTEQIYDAFDHKGTPYIGLSELKMKPFETFQFQVDQFGTIEALIQEMDGEKQELDLNKFVYFVHNPEFDAHYGQSELREAYRSYYSKDVTIRLMNQFLERFAGGFTVAKPVEGATLTRGTAEYNAVRAAIENIRSQTSILFPANIDLETIQPATTDQYERAIVMHDLQIAKALLVPNLLGVTHQGDTGSYAQASTQLEAFMWTLDADAARLQDALNEQVFGPLGKINFADGIGPKIKFKPVSEQKKFDLVNVWKDLVGSKAVEATDTDEQHLRDLLDFPEKGEPTAKPPPPPVIQAPVPGDEEELPVELPDETVIGASSGLLVSREAFTKALKRVSFTVLDRKTNQIEEEHTVVIEGKVASMLASMIETIAEDKLGTPAGDIKAIHSIDFPSREKTKVRKAINASLSAAWKLGVRHSTDEISKAQKEQFRANMGRIDEDAAAFLETNGFRMLGNMTADMKKIIQGILVNGVKFSWTTKDIVDKIYDSLTLAGFLLMESNAVATGRIVDDVAEALQKTVTSPHRIQTAVRTNAFEAINEARYSTFTDPALDGFVEALEYSAILDDRTTEICTHLDGRVYPAESPQWDAIRPPNHFNCRSLLVPVTIIDTEVEGKDKLKGERWSKPPRIEPQQGFGGTTG
jgi:SPP1 gp7 family putative phage head morphogenesis protein